MLILLSYDLNLKHSTIVHYEWSIGIHILKEF